MSLSRFAEFYIQVLLSKYWNFGQILISGVWWRHQMTSDDLETYFYERNICIFILVGNTYLYPKTNRYWDTGHFKAPEGGYFMTSSQWVTWLRYEVEIRYTGRKLSYLYVLFIQTYGLKWTGRRLESVKNRVFWRHQMAAILYKRFAQNFNKYPESNSIFWWL